jgi:hypothetical protein
MILIAKVYVKAYASCVDIHTATSSNCWKLLRTFGTTSLRDGTTAKVVGIVKTRRIGQSTTKSFLIYQETMQLND